MELLWTDFLNTEWHDWRGTGHSEDRLEQPESLRRFLEAWHLAAPVPPDPETLQSLRGLRTLLREVAEGLAAGQGVPDGVLVAINRLMAEGPVCRRLEPTPEGHRLALIPARQGWPQVMAEIAASLAATLAEGEAARVRICENPDCRWVFYDETRNRAKRYCDDKLCGNLMKVRRFRARQRGG
ncbi:MAG: CGNR zinc finger domain-containing protein [Bacillota bacterium]